MQRKRNIQLLISLLVMTAAIVGLFFYGNRNSSSSVNKEIFQIQNLDKVNRITIQSSQETIDLKFNGTKWMVNDKYEADRQMITVLFAALKQVEAKRKVGSTIQDSIQKAISKSGIKISCFEGESLAKEFWSMGNQKSETYFQLKEGEPYLVTIPGYRVYVASVFEVPSNDWRDKRVFNFNWQNFKSLEVSFSLNPKQNFEVSFQGKFFGIEGMNSDTTKLNNFLDAVSLLRADRILTIEQSKAYDSLASLPPIQTITAHDIGNRSYELKVFPIQKNKVVVIAKKDDEIIELNPRGFQEIFKGKDYFKSTGN